MRTRQNAHDMRAVKKHGERETLKCKKYKNPELSEREKVLFLMTSCYDNIIAMTLCKYKDFETGSFLE